MKKVQFSKKTLSAYLDQLASKESVPGGGSVASLAGALGVGLICMVAQYSIGRKSNTPALNKRFTNILKQAEMIRKRLLELASLDSEAYLQLTDAKNADKATQRKASKFARAVPLEVCKQCYKALDLVPDLVAKGNPYLTSDAQVAVELLEASFNGAMVMVRINS